MRLVGFPILQFSIALTFVATTPGNAQQSTPGSVDYLSKLSASTHTLKDETWQYLRAVTQGRGARKVEKTREALLTELASVKSEVSRMEGFDGDEVLKDAALEFLRLSYSVLKEDFDKILDMEEIAEESYDFMEAYLLAKEKANEILHEASDNVQKAQVDFAEEHGITLVEPDDKISQKIESAGEALKYYNKVFLMYFKCFKEESYVMAALALTDTAAIRLHSRNLGDFASDAIAKLDTMDSYRNDPTLKTTGVRVFNFYKTEGEEGFIEMIDFFVQKNRMNQAKARLDAIKERERTAEDVAEFNAAVAGYNKAAQDYNRQNEALNNLRKQRLDEWEKTVAAFFDKHTG